jgi:hypothetical protein
LDAFAHRSSQKRVGLESKETKMLVFTEQLRQAVRSADHIAAAIGYDCRKEIVIDKECVGLRLTRFDANDSPLGKAFTLPNSDPLSVAESVKPHYRGRFTVESYGDGYLVAISA